MEYKTKDGSQKIHVEQMQNILDEIPSGIVVMDADTLEILYINQRAKEYALSDYQSYQGRKCFEYMANEEKQCEGCMVDQVRRFGRACHSRIVRESGKSYATELHKSNWYGRTVITSYISDITEVVQGKKELHQSEKLLRQAIEDAHLLSWEYNFEREELTDENRNLKEAGYISSTKALPETQISGGFIAEESQEAYRKMFADMRAGASTTAAEIWFLKNKDVNDRRCISISYTVNKNGEGKPVSASALGLDITDKKNTEFRHQKQIDSMMHSYPDALGSLVMNLTKDYICDQKRLYSFIKEREDMRISDYLDGLRTQVPTEDYEKYCAAFSKESLLELYQNGEQQRSMIHRFQFMDKIRWIETTVRILPNPVTKDLEAYVFAVDVSEKVLSAQMMDKLINKRYDILALIYPREGFVDFRYTGNEFENLPQMSIDEYDQNRLQSSKLFGDVQAEKYMSSTEMETIQKNLDETGKYSFTMSFVNEHHKRYKRYSYNYLTDDHEIILSTVQDVTSLYEKEEAQMLAIRQALTEAERANAAKTAFLSNMSHDIRTPMNAIINMTKMAQEDIADTEKALEELKKVETSSQFLLSLINDVLDMAKIDSGKMELHPSVYEYSEFLNYINSVFSPLCRNKDIKFVLNKGNSDVPLYIDILRFNQMFFNLLSNAVKYTAPGGTIEYNEYTIGIKDGRLDCVFKISDNGQGMSEAFQKKMFEPFEREEGRSNKQMGTGLGLAIVKSTVDQLGGTIEVESSVGKGSTFTIALKLPLATEEQIKARELETKRAINISLEGKRILVAEDNTINRDIMKRLLERKKILVEMAEDGAKCVDKIKNHPVNYYDAVLMDVRMPILDGLQATRIIRAMDRADAKKLPIIAMTANAFMEDRVVANEAGMSAYLAKPVDTVELYQTLSAMIL